MDIKEKLKVILEVADRSDNRRSADGTVIWDFVSADLHMEHFDVVVGLDNEELDDLFDRAAKILELVEA